MLKTPFKIYSYLKLRAKLLVQSLKDRREDFGETPVPPPVLRHRVHGAMDADSFRLVGTRCYQSIKDNLKLIGKTMDDFTTVLDFGCGCGRTLTNIEDPGRFKALWGIDIDNQAIRWNQKHLPFGQYYCNDPLPPTQFEDNTFELIYAISVFTHLPEDMQFKWLEELRRIAKSGATLILTVHGEHHRELFKSDVTDIQEQGFKFVERDKGVLKLDGLPGFYQDTHHSEEYILREWGKYFEVLRYEDQGMAGNQATVILRKS